MNENNNYDSGNVSPYKASGNLNTAIGNPSVDINDTMNINIQSMNTSPIPSSNSQNYNNTMPNQSNANYSASGTTTQVNTPAPNVYQNVASQNNYVTSNANNQSNYVNKTYVTTDNKPKKKTIKLNLGPEFKVALLIIIVLLVFIFLLPMIHDFISGR